MIIPFHDLVLKGPPLNASLLSERGNSINGSDLSSQLATQWANPLDISVLLFILGGDIVHKALAQGTGTLFVPVCFSFGCVAYGILGLVNILGDGRLLPPPDYQCKVLNLTSKYARENKNFIVGRLLRDLEDQEALEDSLEDKAKHDYALKITVFEGSRRKNAKAEFSWGCSHLIAVVAILLQFGIAVIPAVKNNNWNIILITAAGTLFVQCTGALPQWLAEKVPGRQNSKSVFALTCGNGSRHIMVILGYGNCLDLEAWASSETPRNHRPWERFNVFSKFHVPVEHDESPCSIERSTREAKVLRVWPFRSLPLGFVLTKVSYTLMSIFWLLLLINISTSNQGPDSWCLIAIGAVGMLQNAWIGSKSISSKDRLIPLRVVDRIVTMKVMDGIMDFHHTYEMGRPLLDEFFPGNLLPIETKWWEDGVREEYDEERGKDPCRGEIRSSNLKKFPKFRYPIGRLMGVGERTGEHHRSGFPTLPASHISHLGPQYRSDVSVQKNPKRESKSSKRLGVLTEESHSGESEVGMSWMDEEDDQEFRIKAPQRRATFESSSSVAM